MAKIPNLEAIRDWCKQKFQLKGNYAISSDVKNGKLTIRKNGNDVGYFYANQELDSIIDIEESDTWEPNTKEKGGYVEKGSGHSNKVWKTDENGNPAWRDESSVTSNVTGVKGSKEQSYRTGNVNLTPSNIGAVSTSGDTMNGVLNAYGGISLNGSTTSSNIKYILGIDAYADGGTVHYQNASDVSIGKLGGLGSGLYFCARTTGGNFTGDINAVYNNGAYWCQNATHRPTDDPYGLLIVQAAGTTDVIKHTYIPHIGNGLMGAARERIRVNNIWSPWRVMATEGSDLVCGDYLYMIDDEGRKRGVLRAIGDGSGANNYGSQLMIGAGGNTFIGSGESAGSLYTALQTESNKKTNEAYTKGGENMFISSDGHLYLYSNANQIANRKGLCFSNAGILSPIGDDKLRIHAGNGIFFESNIYFGAEYEIDAPDGPHKLYPMTITSSGEVTFGASAYGQPILTTLNKSEIKAQNITAYNLESANTARVASILYFGSSGTTEKIELGNRMLRFYGYNGLDFQSYIRSDICPTNNGVYTLGKSSYRWKEIWCSTSLNTASDRNLKKNISDLSSDERYTKFFMLLQPKSYLFKDGESGRTHVGFISQDVEDAMAECGLTSLEFAGFCKDQKVEARTEMEEIYNPANEETDEEEWTEEREDRIEEPVFDDEGNPVYEYSLRYEEFIALNTMMIQKQQMKIDKMEERIDKMERMINANTKNPTI